jgi:hypothetical protein
VLLNDCLPVPGRSGGPRGSPMQTLNTPYTGNCSHAQGAMAHLLGVLRVAVSSEEGAVVVVVIAWISFWQSSLLANC